MGRVDMLEVIRALPMTAVEFARRNIDPHERPSFTELEELTRKKAA